MGEYDKLSLIWNFHTIFCLQDIEELPSVAAKGGSRYFSPVQTRKQRQLNALPKSNLPAKKSRLAEISKTTKIQMGTATIIKCEVVPESESTPDMKIEPAGAVKTEQEFPNLNWLQHLENIRLMRNVKLAPVDTMGCHKCADASANEKVYFMSYKSLKLNSTLH